MQPIKLYWSLFVQGRVMVWLFIHRGNSEIHPYHLHVSHLESLVPSNFQRELFLEYMGGNKKCVFMKTVHIGI